MTRTWYEQLVEILGASLIFSSLSPEERWELARGARRVALEEGQLLWAWGEQGDGVAVVLEGALNIQRTFEDGVTIAFRRMGPGEALGFSTLAGEPHTADIAAAEPAVVAVLPRKRLHGLLARRPDLALAIIGHLGHLVGLLSDEKTTWRAGSVERRLCSWLLDNTEVGDELSITHEQLARNVGASRARVSKALGQLAKGGVVRRHRGRLEVLALAPCLQSRGLPSKA